MLLDLTELSSYLPLVSCFEFGNVSGKLFPCTEGRVRTIMVPPGTPRAGAFSVVDALRVATDGGARELLRVVLGEAPGAAGGCVHNMDCHAP